MCLYHIASAPTELSKDEIKKTERKKSSEV